MPSLPVPMDHRAHLQTALGDAYRLEQELGGGGMSRVYVAEETSLGRKVVVKVLPPELLAGANVDRFKREIQLSARLQQAQIVPVLAAGEVDGVPWYTMPFVEGKSLRARLAHDGPLPVGEVVGILRDVARALAYAHERGVVHRDIKPDNVLLSGGSAVVVDFGIAKAISAARESSADSALTQLGTSVGTPAYMSPEQAAGDPDVDHRADLYAFGCMAYELLAGQPPFAGRTPQRTIAAHLTEAPAPVGERRADTPPALAALVMRCLAKDADARPQSAGEVLAALDAAATASGADLPTMLLAGPGAIRRGVTAYVVGSVAIGVLAKAAVVAFGLPDWVFTGALVLLALGLPAVAATAWAQHAARRAAARTPARTGGGSPVPPAGLAALALRTSPHLTWRRTLGAGAVVLGGFTAVVAGIMVLRLFGVGPAASLMAAGALEGRERLLVVDFDAGADTALSQLVTEAVRTNLGQSRVVSIMPPAAIAAALQRMERDAAERVDVRLAREIAVREGAKAVVDGGIAALAGGGYVLRVRLVSADSGQDLAAFRKVVSGPDELLAGIDDLTRQLRGRIGESLKAVRDAPPLERVTTGSLAALQKYAEGVRAADQEADHARAVSLLRDAVRIDTAFAMAYRKLGVTLSNLGMPRAQVDSALERAYRHRDRLTEKERHLAEATYFDLGPSPDRVRAAQGYRAALGVDPHDGVALNNLASKLRERRDYAGAESLYAVLLANGQPTAGGLGNHASALFNTGKLAQSESTFRELARRFPSALPGQLYEAFFLYQRGELDSLDLFWEARRASLNAIVRLNTTSMLSTQALLRGRIAEAQSLIAETQRLNAERGVPENPLTDSLATAGVQIWFLEDHERGVRTLDAALARTPLGTLPLEQRPYFSAAMYYAWAGRTDRARAMLAQFDAEVRDPALRRASEPARQTVLGEIALAEGRPRDALAAFWKSDSLPDGPANDCGHCVYVNLGRAYDLAEQPDSAIAAWERYLSAPYMGRVTQDASYLAGIRKRLGELYEQKGDRRRAAANYSAFLDLWKDADPVLQPRVAEVRRRLAAVQEGAGE